MILDPETFELDNNAANGTLTPYEEEVAAATDLDVVHARLLAGVAILRGFAADHLSRHHYLRARWMGVVGDEGSALPAAEAGALHAPHDLAPPCIIRAAEKLSTPIKAA